MSQYHPSNNRCAFNTRLKHPESRISYTAELMTCCRSADRQHQKWLNYHTSHLAVTFNRFASKQVAQKMTTYLNGQLAQLLVVDGQMIQRRRVGHFQTVQSSKICRRRRPAVAGAGSAAGDDQTVSGAELATLGLHGGQRRTCFSPLQLAQGLGLGVTWPRSMA